MARKSKQASEGASQKWMLTFSDMMTLLLTFFVLLFSMSSMDSEDLQKALEALQSAFSALELGTLGDRSTPQGSILDPSFRIRPDELMAAAQEMRGFIASMNLEDEAQVKKVERGLVVQLAEDALFDSGSAEVKKDLYPVLHKIALLATRLAKTVRVEGNSDSTKLTGGRFHSNLELSAYRAINVLQVILQEKKFTPHGAAVGAFGEFNPIEKQGEGEEAKRANRRVDVYIVDPPDLESFWYALMRSYLTNGHGKD